jgi:hypothetical protein
MSHQQQQHTHLQVYVITQVAVQLQ